MKKILSLVSVVLMVSFLFMAFPMNVESQDPNLNTVVEGTVYDNKTKEPIPYAWVEVWGPTWGHGSTCGPNGEYYFEIDVRLEETLDIMASKPGYYDQWETFTIRRTETKVIDFYLIPMNVSISGHVYDMETEEPLVGAYVQLYSTERDGEDSWTQTDEEGFYEMYGEPGDYVLRSYYQNYEMYESEEFTLAEGQDEVKDIYMEPMQAGIYGIVIDQDGNPVPEAYIRMYTPGWEHYYGAFTDEDGAYEIKAVPETYNFEVSADGYMDYSDTVEIPEDTMVEYNPQIEEITITGVLRYIWEFILEIIGGIV